MINKIKPCKTCREQMFIWSNGNCKTCANKIKINNTSKKVYNTSAIKKVSTRLQKLNAAYKVLRDQFMKANPICQVRIKCSGAKSEDLHHARGRGEYLLDGRYFKALCRECHRWAEENSEQAKALGISLDRLSKEP
jgi:hypothetical protein